MLPMPIKRMHPRLLGRISANNSLLFQTLHVTLIVAPDPIANGDEAEFLLVEDEAVLGGKLDHLFREAVVEPLLLTGVIEGRVTEVFAPVGDEEGFKGWIVLPAEFFA